jgi:hypothetical protein
MSLYISLLDKPIKATVGKNTARNYRAANPDKSIGLAKNSKRKIPKEIVEMTVWN